MAVATPTPSTIAAPTSAPKRPGRERSDARARPTTPKAIAALRGVIRGTASLQPGARADQRQRRQDRLELVADPEEAHAGAGVGAEDRQRGQRRAEDHVDRIGEDGRARGKREARACGFKRRSVSSANARRTQADGQRRGERARRLDAARTNSSSGAQAQRKRQQPECRRAHHAGARSRRRAPVSASQIAERHAAPPPRDRGGGRGGPADRQRRPGRDRPRTRSGCRSSPRASRGRGGRERSGRCRSRGQRHRCASKPTSGRRESPKPRSRSAAAAAARDCRRRSRSPSSGRTVLADQPRKLADVGADEAQRDRPPAPCSRGARPAATAPPGRRGRRRSGSPARRRAAAVTGSRASRTVEPRSPGTI